MEEQRCSSCGAILTGEGTVLFKCPSCGDSMIGRCVNCREQSVSYSSKACCF
ncbi:MAG: DUF1610 domain-containing protein [Methanobacteriota archaeon]|nr:MAG: DUF1610 domain-containing protein [Euryarchaeota archaeon]